jgi:TRAP-type mannitol/chloroaromatic compound transport system substrate-binding protein
MLTFRAFLLSSWGMMTAKPMKNEGGEMSDRTTSRRSVLTGALAAGAAVAAPNVARAQTTFTWNVQSHWPAASTSFTDSLTVTRDVLLDRTGGQLKLQLYGAGELFKGPEIFNAVGRGVVEMGSISPSYLLKEATSANIIFGVPGTFQEVWQLAQFLKNLGGERLLRDELLPKNIIYRSEKAYATEMVLKTPVKSQADFNALIVRSTGSLASYLTEGGAKTTATPGGELHEALSKGTIDGAHWGAAQGAYSLKLYDVAKYHIRPPLSLNSDGFIINKGAFDKLPKDLQQILLITLEERFWRRTFGYMHQEEVTLQQAKKELGVKVVGLPDAVQAQLRKAAKIVQEQERAKGGAAAEGMAMMESFLGDLGYA